jgi:hypothetical protein
MFIPDPQTQFSIPDPQLFLTKLSEILYEMMIPGLDFLSSRIKGPEKLWIPDP